MNSKVSGLSLRQTIAFLNPYEKAKYAFVIKRIKNYLINFEILSVKHSDKITKCLRKKYFLAFINSKIMSFNFDTNLWIQIKSRELEMPNLKLSNHQFFTTSDSNFFILGGYNNSSVGSQNIWIYHIPSDNFEKVGNLDQP